MGADITAQKIKHGLLIKVNMIQISLQAWQMEYIKYDLMRDYFLSIPIEEQDKIWEEVGPELEKRDAQIKRLAARKALSVSAKK